MFQTCIFMNFWLNSQLVFVNINYICAMLSSQCTQFQSLSVMMRMWFREEADAGAAVQPSSSPSQLDHRHSPQQQQAASTVQRGSSAKKQPRAAVVCKSKPPRRSSAPPRRVSRHRTFKFIAVSNRSHNMCSRFLPKELSIDIKSTNESADLSEFLSN